jgi:hypothetical protein
LSLLLLLLLLLLFLLLLCCSFVCETHSTVQLVLVGSSDDCSAVQGAARSIITAGNWCCWYHWCCWCRWSLVLTKLPPLPMILLRPLPWLFMTTAIIIAITLVASTASTTTTTTTPTPTITTTTTTTTTYTNITLNTTTNS